MSWIAPIHPGHSQRINQRLRASTAVGPCHTDAAFLIMRTHEALQVLAGICTQAEHESLCPEQLNHVLVPPSPQHLASDMSGSSASRP